MLPFCFFSSLSNFSTSMDCPNWPFRDRRVSTRLVKFNLLVVLTEPLIPKQRKCLTNSYFMNTRLYDIFYRQINQSKYLLVVNRVEWEFLLWWILSNQDHLVWVHWLPNKCGTLILVSPLYSQSLKNYCILFHMIHIGIVEGLELKTISFSIKSVMKNSSDDLLIKNVCLPHWVTIWWWAWFFIKVRFDLYITFIVFVFALK